MQRLNEMALGYNLSAIDKQIQCFNKPPKMHYRMRCSTCVASVQLSGPEVRI